MKLSSKKTTAKKINFAPINRTQLRQVKGGKKLHSIKDKSDQD